jgi:glutamate dehydrogenase (NAD(P)+)
MTTTLDSVPGAPQQVHPASDPLAAAKIQPAEAIDILGDDQGVYSMLATPRREVTVSIPLRREECSWRTSNGFKPTGLTGGAHTTSRAGSKNECCKPGST